MISAAQFADLAESIAREAAEFAAAARERGVSVAATKSTPVDVVTEADRDTEALIRSRLVVARPDDGFLGEESEPTPAVSGYTWVVDPIDGTVNYLYGIPHYAISIAVVHGSHDPTSWNSLAGVVINPASGDVYRAESGGGSWLNGQPLRLDGSAIAAHALVGTGFGYSAARRQWQGNILSSLIPHVRDIRRMGSAALDLCRVADGTLDAYYERGLNPWDQAAGALIAREAGAFVGGLNGAAATSEFLLAAPPLLFSELHELLIASGADQPDSGADLSENY